MVSLVEEGVEEKEAVEEAVRGCRAVQALSLTSAIWRLKQTGEDGVVQPAAAMEEAVDESTADTVRAMGGSTTGSGTGLRSSSP